MVVVAEIGADAQFYLTQVQEYLEGGLLALVWIEGQKEGEDGFRNSQSLCSIVRWQPEEGDQPPMYPQSTKRSSKIPSQTVPSFMSAAKLSEEP